MAQSAIATRPMLKRTAIVSFLVVLATAVSAADHRYTFTGSFTSSDVPAYISVGDRFALSFDYNTAATDASADLQEGIFVGAISNLTFSLTPEATGTYAGGTMTGPQFLQLTDNLGGYDSLNFYASSVFPIPGLSFSDAGAHPFASFQFSLYSSLNAFALPNAMGDSLATVLPELDLSDYDNTREVAVIFDGFDTRAYASIESITRDAGASPRVPESGNVALLAMAALTALIAATRRFAGLR